MGLPCAICGQPIDYSLPADGKHPGAFVIDEIRPISRHREFGYETAHDASADWNNLQPAHYICNARKGARTMEELKRKRIIAHTISDGDW